MQTPSDISPNTLAHTHAAVSDTDTLTAVRGTHPHTLNHTHSCPRHDLLELYQTVLNMSKDRIYLFCPFLKDKEYDPRNSLKLNFRYPRSGQRVPDAILKSERSMFNI